LQKPPLPLPTLLSFALIAFTIEFDNEFERRSPHRLSSTKKSGAGRTDPWLGSMAIWSNFMRCVPPAGVTVGELQRLCRTERLLLDGMERWGYITLEPDPADPRPKPPQSDWIIRPTEKGALAQAVWRPLYAEIEDRWRERFGSVKIEQLREALWLLLRQFDRELPEYMPIYGFGLTAEVIRGEGRPKTPGDGHRPSDLHLPVLLSKVLLAFTIDFESQSDVSLAICANILRVLGANRERIRDLPQLTGISKEAIAMALGFLEKRGYASSEKDSGDGRTRWVALTAKGRKAEEEYLRRLTVVEEEWRARLGAEVVHGLRKSLEPLVSDGTAATSPLFRGLVPHPVGWRAAMRKPDLLPHHPMVLHRGGYPDGS
jgi:DNA-binding MarR family transcriptional regulator